MFIPPAEFWPKKALDLLLWKYSKPLHMELRFFSCACLLFSSTVLIFVTSLVPPSLSCYYLASSNLLSVSTERPLPPRKLSVPQDEVESRQLRIHWVTGGSASSPLRYFTLQIKELPNGDWKTHTADILHNMTSWTVDRYTHTCTYAQLQWLIHHPLNLWHFIYRQFKVQYFAFFYYTFQTKNSKEKVIFLTVSHNCKCQHDWLLAKLQCLSLIRRK